MRIARPLLLLVAACGARTGLGSGGVASSDAGKDGAASDASNACQDEVLAYDTVGATALAVDGDTVFWGTIDGRVLRHDASGIVTLATEASAVTAIAFDASRVYYALVGFLRSVPRGGGAATTIADEMGQPIALTVDEGTAFLLDRGAGITAGRALRVELDGTVTPLLTGLDVPSGLAVDATNIYVPCQLAILDAQAIEGPLLSVAKTGGTPVVVTSGLNQPSSIALDSSRLFFVDQVDVHFTLHGGVRAMDKAGGTVTTIATTPDVLPLDVTVDPGGVYVTTYSNTAGGDLFVASLDGSKKSSLASTPGVLYGFVRTNAHAVYWTINWSGVRHEGAPSVRKHCK